MAHLSHSCQPFAGMQIRDSIKALFPDRDCLTLVRPMGDEKMLAKLETLDPSQFRPEFQEVCGLSLPACTSAHAQHSFCGFRSYLFQSICSTALISNLRPSGLILPPLIMASEAAAQLQGLSELTKVIFHKAQPKRMNNSIITGPMLAALTEAYVDAINKGAVPTIATAWQVQLHSNSHLHLVHSASQGMYTN